MMHLKCPRKKYYYEWEELSCLSRALGFHHGVIQECLPEDLVKKENGISHRDLMKYIDLKFFNDALDRSANMHTAVYNIIVLKKSIELLNHRLLSFDELSDVRVAFQVYEAGDMRGMAIDQHVLMRTLKLSGRTIAPLKLMHRVKHMEDRLDEPGRLQLYEFMDLIALCEVIDQIHVPESRHQPLDKTWRKLFELDEFEDVFTTSDQKLEGLMDSLFVQEERNYGKERLGSTRIPKEASVETSARKELVRYHKQKYKELNESISRSTSELKRTKAGTVRPRPVTAADVDGFRSRLSSERQRPHTVAEFFSSFETPSFVFGSRPHTAPVSCLYKTIDSMRVGDPRIQILLNLHKRKSSQSQTSQQPPRSGSTRQLEDSRKISRVPARPKTPLVVTDGDVQQREQLLDSLQYEIETLEERSIQRLEARLGRSLQSRHRQRSEKEESLTTEAKKDESENGWTTAKVKESSRGQSLSHRRPHQHHYKDSTLAERLNFIREQTRPSEQLQTSGPDQHLLVHDGKVPVDDVDSRDLGSKKDHARPCASVPLHHGEGLSENDKSKGDTVCDLPPSINEIGIRARFEQTRRSHPRLPLDEATRAKSRIEQQREGGKFCRGKNVNNVDSQASTTDRGLLRPSVIMRDQFEGSRVGTAATLYKYLRGELGEGKGEVYRGTSLYRY